MKKNGFTLVEMLIVVTIIGLILPAFFSIVLAVLRQQVRVQYMSEIKREGDNVLTLLKNKIGEGNLLASNTNRLADPSDRSYRTAHEVCTVNDIFHESPAEGPLFFITDNDTLTEYFRFFEDSTTQTVKYESNATSTPIDITGSAVTITDFRITCKYTSLYGSPFVGISFTVTQKFSVSPTEAPLSLYYSTKVKMRTR